MTQAADNGRFDALDGMRGVAAFLVVFHHLGFASGHPRLFRTGFLSVDLFFILSGFIISHAYNGRFDCGMTLPAFAWTRLKRLYPIMALGIILGFLLAVSFGADQVPSWYVIPQFLLLPNPKGTTFFPFNAVQWTLSLELGANFVHVLLHRHVTTRRLILVTTAAALFLLYTSFHFGQLAVGWNRENWWGGIARLLFGYPAGMLLYRLHKEARLPFRSMPFLPLAALLCGAIIFSSAFSRIDWLSQFAIVTILFPALTVATIGAKVEKSILGRLVLGMGLLSYPVYALHAPIIRAWKTMAGSIPPAALLPFWISALIVATAAAWVVATVFDPAAQNFLKKRGGRQGPLILAAIPAADAEAGSNKELL